MDIREAARQISDKVKKMPFRERLGTKYESLEDIILEAFALAGYGWLPIEEAKKDGTVYHLYYPDLEAVTLGSWKDGSWKDVSGCPAFLMCQPTKFHVMLDYPTQI